MKIEQIQVLEGKFDRLAELLENQNHFWAVIVSDQISTLLESSNAQSSEKYHYYNHMIRIWENYIKTLVEHLYENWPFVYSAYQQLFNILFITKDHNKIAENGLRLARILVQINFATKDKIAEMLDSLAVLTFQADDYRDAIKIIFLAIYFRGTYLKTPYAEKSFQLLDQVIQHLSPDQRPILLNSFLSKAFFSFFTNPQESSEELWEKYTQFLNDIYRISVNAVSGTLRESFHLVKKLHSQYRDLLEQEGIFNQTIFNLQINDQHTWAYSIVSDYIQQLQSQKGMREAAKYLHGFIDRCLKQGAYQTAFDAYVDLAKLFPNKGFPVFRAKFWAEACWNFRDNKNKIYFVTAVDRFREVLQTHPETDQMGDYLFAINEYYRITRGYIANSERVFWQVVLHRSIFEEGFEDIAKFVIHHQFKDDPNFLRLMKENIPLTLQKHEDEKNIGENLDIGGMTPKKITLKIRIPKEKPIKIHSLIYYEGFTKESLLETSEIWNEEILTHMYLALYGEKAIEERSLFGKIAYLLLPDEIRRFFSTLNVKTSHIPEVLMIIDEPSFPFEILEAMRAPLGSRFAFGYRFREPKLSNSQKSLPEISSLAKSGKIRFLGIGDMNDNSPQIWDDQQRKNIPIYKFTNGMNHIRNIGTILQHYPQFLEESTLLNSQAITYGILEEKITAGQLNIIYLACNLFYLKESPLDSYLITPDNKILSFRNFLEMLDYAQTHNQLQKIPYTKPLLIFDGQVLDEDKKVINRPFLALSHISQKISSKDILGVFARISILENEYVNQYLHNFLEQVIANESLGGAILTANRKIFLESFRLQKTDPNQDSLIQSLKEPQFAFFGDPSVKIQENNPLI